MTTATPPVMQPNPLREGLTQQRVPEPNCFVIFGATGDLTRRKLVPALYRLYTQRLLPAGFSILCVGRRPVSDDEFRAQLRTAMGAAAGSPDDSPVWESFASGIRYIAFDFDDAEGYKRLDQALKEQDAQRGTSGNRLYYLATPPAVFATRSEEHTSEL